MGPIIGIDLGTSYSCAAAVRDDAVFAVEDSQGRKTLPSVVHYGKGGDVVVGYDALHRMLDDPENTIHSAKRILGSRFGDPAVRIAQSAYLFKITDGPNHWPLLEARGGPHAVPSICANIIRELKRRAEEFFGEQVTQAVITVPAMANDAQREQTRIAGRIAGLEVIGLLNEPTAAALAYSLLRVGGKNLAVYDFGGGTFDCSVIAWKEPAPQVLATHGDSFLGGDDIDLAIGLHVAQTFHRKTGIDVRSRSADWKRVLLASEAAKRTLSRRTTASINLSSIAHTKSGPIDLEVDLDRELLERLASPYITQTVDLMREAIGMSGLGGDQLDQVLLVGGSSRLPQVRSAVQKAFRDGRGPVPLVDVDPDLAVVIGAAVEAQRLSGQALPSAMRQQSAVVEVVPSSFGLATAGGGFDPVIVKNSPLPAQGMRSYTTWRDGQTDMTFVVLQGESDRASENMMLGEFQVSGLPPSAAGEVDVEVHLEVATDGLLRVTAKNTMTGEAHHLGLRVGDVLTTDDGANT